MKLYFTDVQIIYKPLHEVSGDFYWFWGGDNKCITAVVDCTGHGVSGAFMSMIGHTLLNEIVNEKKIHEPADILEILHLEIVTALNQEKGRNNDGMDIALCVIEQEDLCSRKVTFAGAKRPLYYTKNQELKQLKGNRCSIGGYQRWSIYNEKPFHNEVVHLTTNDRIYLFSDGFTDQPSKDHKKYGTKRLIDFLQNHIATPLEEQKNLLETDLQQQICEESPQRDDITFLFIQL